MPKLKDAPAPPPPVAEPRRSRTTPAGAIGPAQKSGHCEIADQVSRGIVSSNKTEAELHATCKGAVSNGVGSTWLCTCACHDGKLYCHRCGFDHTSAPYEDYNFDRRQCIDATACANKIRDDFEVLRKTDPTMRLLDECRAAGDEERAAKNAEKARRKAEEAERARDRGETPEPAKEASSRPGRPTKAPQRCHEGCGGMTKGGRFLMGHDMKLKGQLFEVARKETSMNAVFAATEILARGWSIAGIDPGVLKTAQSEYRGLGELEAVRVAVERRYA